MSIEDDKRLQGILKLLEPAIIVTLLASSMYLAGWTYTDSYFSWLSIDPISLEFPTLYYLIKGFYPTLIVTFLICFTLAWARQPPKNIPDALRGNILMFALAACLFCAGMYSPFYVLRFQKTQSILFLSMALILTILTVIVTFQKKSVAYYLWNMPPIKRVVGFIIALLFCSVVGDFFGNLTAGNLITGKQTTFRLINLTLKTGSNASNTIKGKQLILMLHRKGNYYVIERVKQWQGYPHILIIPESEVALAETCIVVR